MCFVTLGVIASSIENLAVEIRHLQRSEVREAEEYFSEGQKGSSAMPHKRNPILSENLTGLARNIRSSVTPALENVALWHERDISHSSTERLIAPNSCVTLDFALHRLTGLVKNLIIHPDRMKKNMESLGGLVFSQRTLLALTQAGILRENAYRIVQRNAMKVWKNDAERSFLDYLKDDPEVMAKLDPDDLKKIFDYNFYTKNIDYIFERAFG
jgi:adenylosuccinate lyase